MGMPVSRRILIAVLVAVAAAFFADRASSAAFNNAFAITTAAPAVIATVQCCGLEWDRSDCCDGTGYFGGILVAPYHGPGAVYADRRHFDLAPGEYAGPLVDAEAVAYCARRFRSYDPRSGTYLGRDGYRHPCP
jgi:hypothetical protein